MTRYYIAFLILFFVIAFYPAFKGWLLRRRFRNKVVTFTISGSGHPIQKGDIVKTSSTGIYGKVVNVSNPSIDQTIITVKQIKNKTL
jgi:hypothetical protein